MTKLEALTKLLDCDASEISEENDDTFTIGRQEYLVLTDDEADEKAKELILDSAWAFKPEFLAAHSADGVDEETIKSIQDNDRCESNNPVILRLIRDTDHFVSDAIMSDGRGHFISGYDGEEQEQGQYFIYRLN